MYKNSVSKTLYRHVYNIIHYKYISIVTYYAYIYPYIHIIIQNTYMYTYTSYTCWEFVWLVRSHLSCREPQDESRHKIQQRIEGRGNDGQRPASVACVHLAMGENCHVSMTGVPPGREGGYPGGRSAGGAATLPAGIQSPHWPLPRTLGSFSCHAQILWDLRKKSSKFPGSF